jgi:DNA-binding NtrC family response regulator
MNPFGTTEATSLTMTSLDHTPESPLAAPIPGHAYMLVFERGASWVFELPHDGEIIIGRGELAELRLRDTSVSRRHATLRLTPSSVVLRDLGSHNGTFVNGQRLTADRPLRPGDSLGICGATLVLYTAAPIAETSRWLPYPSFRARFDEELERSLRYQRPVTLLYGLLARAEDRDEVARRTPALRALDLGAWTDPRQLFIMAPETDRDEAEQLARRIRGVLHDVDLRLGYAICPSDGCDADTLMISARAAAAGADEGTVGVAATALRTYRIGERNVIVADPAMARLYALVERLARVDLPVLINGETGTGKELAATMLHERSPRRERPLVALNCAAIQESLVESELFGYERGAFTGAAGAKPGLLESATGGTVFLDEIGELPLAIQAKLLRVLETKRVTRLGDLREREINIRLVAATNRHLPDEIAAGRFREDLFFRLSGATLTIPPLRDRHRELPLLAELFLSEASRATSRHAITLTPAALARLEAHRWPGNVRELKNVMEYLAATLQGNQLDAAHLDERLGPAAPPTAPASSPGATAAPTTFLPIADELRALEMQRMLQALEAAGGNQTRAAELISMPVRTFFTKVRQYGLKR